MTTRLFQSLQTTCPPVSRLVIGYSGGMDSHVLLHAVATAVQRGLLIPRTITAVYVDHGLQAASNDWGKHCAHVCEALDVPFHTVCVNAAPTVGESPEAAARHARYAALSAVLDEKSALLTAHHREDQAETLLLQLLRGAGPHGLAAMPVVAKRGRGWLWRPFLQQSRTVLSAYATQHDLQWIEDTSNADGRFDRNFLRQKIFPLLQTRWPAAHESLSRSAGLCAQAAALLDTQADSDLVTCQWDQNAGTLSASAVRALHPIRQRNVLRRWLRKQALPTPDHRQLQQLQHDMLTAAPNRPVCVRWPGAEVRRYRDALYAMRPLPPHDSRQTFDWQANSEGVYPPLEIPGWGRLSLHASIGEGLRAADVAGTLTIRFRQGGERFHPAGRSHSTVLKKLLQAAHIPPWERERLPLLYRGDALLAVFTMGIAADAATLPGESGWQWIVQR